MKLNITREWLASHLDSDEGHDFTAGRLCAPVEGEKVECIQEIQRQLSELKDAWRESSSWCKLE